MKEIIDSTDKKRIGETIDETQNPITFKDGETMYVVGRVIGTHSTLLYNSNYQIRIGE